MSEQADFPRKNRNYKSASLNTNLCGRKKPDSKKKNPKNFIGARDSGLKMKTELDSLRKEIEFLTSYSSDTVYRLRYSDMRYDYISPAVTRLLGFGVEEIKKVNFRSLIVETRIVTNGMRSVDSFDDLEKKRKGGDVGKWQADYLIRTKSGDKIWVSDISYPWFDKNGDIIGSVGTLRDISERVQIEGQIKGELEKLANTDSLTGIANRREFFTVLDKELRRMGRSEEPVSVLIIDIDHFKKVNDLHGHDVGDIVLVNIGRIIKSCVRETDIAARLGGEEFGVVLPMTDSQGAFWVAERIRKSVMKHEFSLGVDKATISCSVSIGSATASQSDKKDSSELYKIADTRLYIAKNTGRNQVSVDEIMQTH